MSSLQNKNQDLGLCSASSVDPTMFLFDPKVYRITHHDGQNTSVRSDSKPAKFALMCSGFDYQFAAPSTHKENGQIMIVTSLSNARFLKNISMYFQSTSQYCSQECQCTVFSEPLVVQSGNLSPGVTQVTSVWLHNNRYQWFPNKWDSYLKVASVKHQNFSEITPSFARLLQFIRYGCPVLSRPVILHIHPNSLSFAFRPNSKNQKCRGMVSLLEDHNSNSRSVSFVCQGHPLEKDIWFEVSNFIVSRTLVRWKNYIYSETANLFRLIIPNEF